MKKIFFLLFPLFIFDACKTAAPISTASQARMLQFGEGGGFTGTYEEYRLSENGELYRFQAASERWIVHRILDKTQAAQLFLQADESDMTGMDFYRPGNITYYIELLTENTHYRVTWGSPSAFPPEKITSLYKALLAEARKE